MIVKQLREFKDEIVNGNYLFFQPAFASAIAVFAAVLISNRISFSREYFIVLSAFLASQTTIGTSFKQGLLFTGILLLAVLFGTAIKFLDYQIIIYSIIAITFILISCYATINRFQINKHYFSFLIFALLICLIALTTNTMHATIRNRVLDILIGASIGIVSAQIIFPVKIEQAFRQGIIPLLKNLSVYSNILGKAFITDSIPQNELFEEKLKIYHALQQNYPEWIYDVGFNPGLRSGIRFFLLKLEEVIDIFLSLTYYFNIKLDTNILLGLNDDIKNTLNKNQELLKILSKFFSDKKIDEIKSNFTNDIVNLENALHHIVPDNLQLISLSPSYIVLAGIVRDIKDMRIALLALVQALPINSS